VVRLTARVVAGCSRLGFDRACGHSGDGVNSGAEAGGDSRKVRFDTAKDGMTARHTAMTVAQKKWRWRHGGDFRTEVAMGAETQWRR